MTTTQTALKKLSSKAWRMSHLYKIKDKSGKLITFKPNYIQRKHIVERRSHRYNLVLKARQHGMTTLYAIEALDEALWRPGTNCAIIAHEREALLKIFEIVRRAYQNLHPDLMPKTATDTTQQYRFVERYDGVPLDSSIYVSLKVRSGTVQRLHITESAYVKDRQELIAGSKQAVPKDGFISEETTANGYEAFYELYNKAQEKIEYGDYDYKPYFYPWFDNPEYQLPGTIEDITDNELELRDKYNLTDQQLLWRRWKVAELQESQATFGLSGQQLFKQEYPNNWIEAFQVASGNVFDAEKLDSITPVKPIEKKTWGLHIFEQPIPGKNYVIGVDPSGGQAGDRSSIQIFEDESITQVAEFVGKVRPDELAEITKQAAELYNDAFVGIENNMLSTILFFSKIYENYYSTFVMDEKARRKTKKIGWNTNVKTREVMIDDFVVLFEKGEIEIKSSAVLNEMRTFIVNDNGKREHATGKNDDALIACMIAVQMRKYNKPRGRVFDYKPEGF